MDYVYKVADILGNEEFSHIEIIQHSNMDRVMRSRHVLLCVTEKYVKNMVCII